jgi:magnesium chelatase accessory protein
MSSNEAALTWAHDGADWPHHERSRFVEAGGLRWHVQVFDAAEGGASAPVAWLIHGTGASTHSWAGLAPLLAARYRVIAMDLPGHAFTSNPGSPGLSLPGMAQGLAALREALGVAAHEVQLVVGHSAGAAIGVRMALDAAIAPARIVSINGALLPLSGLAGQWFAPAARLLAATAWAPRWFARRASDPAVLKRLLDATGSHLDVRGTDLYGRLVCNPAHAAGALSMMANWDLPALEADLPSLRVPLQLIVGEADRTVPPAQAQRVKLRVPGATIVRLAGLGHLAHEEAPQRVVEGVLGG